MRVPDEALRSGVLRGMRFGLLACVLSAFAAEADEPEVWHPASDWPILKTYDRDHLYRIGLPVGGIGTGTVTFGGAWETCDVNGAGEAGVRIAEGDLKIRQVRVRRGRRSRAD